MRLGPGSLSCRLPQRKKVQARLPEESLFRPVRLDALLRYRYRNHVVDGFHDWRRHFEKVHLFCFSLKRIDWQNHLCNSEIAASFVSATFLGGGLTTHRDLPSV